MSKEIRAARLACSVLLGYPDDTVLGELPAINAVAAELPIALAEPLQSFVDHLMTSDALEVQEHYVSVFDMKRKASPYLSYWTDGDTRNRGVGILRFKQAYRESGFEMGDDELADHLAVVLEFAAFDDTHTGEALLAEHAGPIRLLGEALRGMGSPYAHLLDVVVATLPDLTPAVRARMEELAAGGPPAEQVGLEPFGVGVSVELNGARR